MNAQANPPSTPRVDYLAQAKARAEEKARAQHAVREAREDRNRIAAEVRLCLSVCGVLCLCMCGCDENVAQQLFSPHVFIRCQARRREKAAAQASAERTAEFRTQLGDAQVCVCKLLHVARLGDACG